jgi:hypothetical protein
MLLRLYYTASILVGQVRYVELKDGFARTCKALRRCWNYIWHYQYRGIEMLDKVTFIDFDGVKHTVLISVATGVVYSHVKVEERDGEAFFTSVAGSQ